MENTTSIIDGVTNHIMLHNELEILSMSPSIKGNTAETLLELIRRVGEWGTLGLNMNNDKKALKSRSYKLLLGF